MLRGQSTHADRQRVPSTDATVKDLSQDELATPTGLFAEPVQHKPCSRDAINVVAAFSSKEVLTSPIFRILVGPSRTPIQIHRDLFHGLSMPLDSMLNNGMMRESLEGQAHLLEEEPDVFLHIAKIVYQIQSIGIESYRKQGPMELSDCTLEERLEDDSPAGRQELVLRKWQNFTRALDMEDTRYGPLQHRGQADSLAVIAKAMCFADKYLMNDIKDFILAGFAFALMHLLCSNKAEDESAEEFTDAVESPEVLLPQDADELQPLWEVLGFIFQDAETSNILRRVRDMSILAVCRYHSEFLAAEGFRIAVQHSPLLALAVMDALAVCYPDNPYCDNCGRDLSRRCSHFDRWSFRSCDNCCLDCTS